MKKVASVPRLTPEENALVESALPMMHKVASFM